MWPPGGPLCEGDIEEVEGVLQVFCPWHDYDFDLRTGKSGTSLQVNLEPHGHRKRMLRKYDRNSGGGRRSAGLDAPGR